jgi:hypothetical protein
MYAAPIIISCVRERAEKEVKAQKEIHTIVTASL